MKKIYSPDNYRAVFCDNPSIVITDSGDIYSGDHFNALFPGTLLGRVDFGSGEVFSAENGIWGSPVFYFERSGDEIRVYDRVPLFAAPVFYIRSSKIYTPENVNSLFDNPLFYIEDLDEPAAPAYSASSAASSACGGYTPSYSSSRASSGAAYSYGHVEPGPIASLFSMIAFAGMIIAAVVFGFNFITGTVIPGYIEDKQYEAQRKEERHMLFNETGVEWFSDTHYAITGYLGEIVPKDCQTYDYIPETDCTVCVTVTSDDPNLQFEAKVVQEPDSRSIGRKTRKNGETFFAEAGQEFTVVINRVCGRGLYVADVNVIPE